MRHLANGGCDGRDGVSIHASVKDATQMIYNEYYRDQFQSTHL